MSAGYHLRIIAVLLCSPLIIFVIHICLSRSFRKSSPQILAVQSAFIGYIPTSLLLWHFQPQASLFAEYSWIWLYSIITYAGFAYAYFHFFNMSETARRIRIMYEIYLSGSIRIDDILAVYNTSDQALVRLKRLVELGQLEYSDGCYRIEGKTLLAAARILVFWRRILGFQE